MPGSAVAVFLAPSQVLNDATFSRTPLDDPKLVFRIRSFPLAQEENFGGSSRSAFAGHGNEHTHSANFGVSSCAHR